MNNYYLNLETKGNPNNDNEVHQSTCFMCPKLNRIYLGLWNNGVEAVAEAKRRGYHNADGCKRCAPEAHKK